MHQLIVPLPLSRLDIQRDEAGAEQIVSRAEAAVLDRWLELSDQVGERLKKLREAEKALDAKAYAQYPKLTEAEVKTLVVDGKWLAALEAASAASTIGLAA